MAQKLATALCNRLEFSRSRRRPRIRKIPRTVAPAAAACRRCSNRARHPRLRPSSGPAGGRRRARHKGTAFRPGVAGDCRVGREPQGSHLRVAQSTRFGPQSDPYGIWARLPVHWNIALQSHRARSPRSQASKAAGSSSSAERPTIAPVWFQFELVAETSTNSVLWNPDASLTG